MATLKHRLYAAVLIGCITVLVRFSVCLSVCLFVRLKRGFLTRERKKAF